MEYRSLYWEDVEEGQQLPPITYELSLLRLVAFVRASGLYDYIHFDRDYAQSIGMRDAFMSTPHLAGLFSRLLTDWSGPEAGITSLSFSMRGQCCAGDTLQVSGKVGKKYRSESGEYLVDLVDLNIGHPLAPQAAGATATMVFPSRVGGPVKLATGRGKAPTQPLDPAIPEFAKALIGQVKADSSSSDRALTEHEIHLWCEALEDWNPLYWDKDYAAKSRFGNLIAPPAMGWFYGAGTGVSAGVGVLKPGVETPHPVKRGLTGLPLLQSLREGLIAANTPFSLPEFPEAVVMLARDDYFIPVRSGDVLHSTVELLNCGPLKKTKIGEGHFLSFAKSSYNQRKERVKTMTLTLFHYHT